MAARDHAPRPRLRACALRQIRDRAAGAAAPVVTTQSGLVRHPPSSREAPGSGDAERRSPPPLRALPGRRCRCWISLADSVSQPEEHEGNCCRPFEERWLRRRLPDERTFAWNHGWWRGDLRFAGGALTIRPTGGTSYLLLLTGNFLSRRLAPR